MIGVRFVAFRYLTGSDFFNMYKAPGTEAGGGGQRYIDFPTRKIPASRWRAFFAGIAPEERVKHGPQWTAAVRSIGLPGKPSQSFTLYQRRAQTFSIPAQNIHSGGSRRGARSRRIRAWHPSQGFPEPKDSQARGDPPAGLAIYLVRTEDDRIWAGWLGGEGSASSPARDDAARSAVAPLVRSKTPGAAGFIELEPGRLGLDVVNLRSPFATPPEVLRSKPAHEAPREDALMRALFDEDDQSGRSRDTTRRRRTALVRNRNTSAVKGLKQLYDHKCQITGTQFLFEKGDGTRYTEAHHLVPLGEDGEDNPRNIIVVGPLLHKMLHYARVSGVDFSRIQVQPDGSATLTITINDRPYTVTWHRKHAQKVLQYGRARRRG